MKKILLWLIAAVLLIPIVTACSDDNIEQDPGNSPHPVLSSPVEGIVSYDSINDKTIIIWHSDSAYVDANGAVVNGCVYIPDSDQFFDKNNKPVSLPIGSTVFFIIKNYSKEGVTKIAGKTYENYGVSIRYIAKVIRTHKSVTCATKDDEDVIISRSFSDEAMYYKRIKVAIHFLRNLDGTGAEDAENTKAKVLNKLNDYLSGTLISCELVSTDFINYFDAARKKDFSFDKESTLTPIYSLRPSHDVIHIFIRDHEGFDVEDISGISQSIPGFAMIIDSYYVNTTNTVAHELGHCLGLYHTHRGTSRYVRERYPKLVDIDTYRKGEDGIAELVDGSNSDVAGDFMTDTPADPKIWLWRGVDNYIYNGGDEVKDANGDTYHPDKNNIMSHVEIASNFSFQQKQMMHYTLSTYMPQVMYKVSLSGPSHFNSYATYTHANVPEKTFRWRVVTYTPSNVDDGDPEMNVSIYKVSTLNLSASGSRLYEISLLDNESSAFVGSMTATAGPPSPICGRLFWKTNQYGTWEGSTTNKDWGSTLYVSGNTTLYLEYQDVTGAKLTNLGYRTVTTANRVLDGSTITITPSDCARGFLKFRLSDSSGQGLEYFTIPITVVGGYYAVNVDDNNGLTFSGMSGASPSGRPSAPVKAPKISSIEIFDSNGNSVYKAENLDAMNYTISRSGWSQGDYRAVISDGVGGEVREVPFAI